MKQTIASIASIFAFHISIFAGPLDRDSTPQGVTFAINGKFYHDLKLVSVIGDVAEFESKEGRVSAAWLSLPVSYQAQHAKEKAAFAEEKAALEARLKAANVDPKAVRVRIFGKVEKTGKIGLLVNCPQIDDTSVYRGERRPGFVFGRFYLTGHPKQADIVDNEWIDVEAVENGTYSYGSNKVKQYRLIQVYPR